MNNHDKIRAAVKNLVESEIALDKAWQASATAFDVRLKATSELARQIHNVCPEQRVICGDRVYFLVGSDKQLVIEVWDGVIL
jgi:hypothetical protein